VRWIGTFAEPRIVMGDFNSNPETSDLNSVNVPDTRVGTVHPSDHDPVVAVLTVK